MKVPVLSALLLLFAVGFASAADNPNGKIKVLVLTGGHGFKPEPFFKVFQDNPEIVYTAASHGLVPTQSAEAYDRADLYDFDVVVLYDSPSTITDSQKARFLALFEKGKGVVILHHASLSSPTWSEYDRTAGGIYFYTSEQKKAGLKPSGYTREMVKIPVTVADRKNPFTAGLEDFVLRDELYTN